jgi:hypothetical protein
MSMAAEGLDEVMVVVILAVERRRRRLLDASVGRLSQLCTITIL